MNRGVSSCTLGGERAWGSDEVDARRSFRRGDADASVFIARRGVGRTEVGFDLETPPRRRSLKARHGAGAASSQRRRGGAARESLMRGRPSSRLGCLLSPRLRQRLENTTGRREESRPGTCGPTWSYLPATKDIVSLGPEPSEAPRLRTWSRSSRVWAPLGLVRAVPGAEGKHWARSGGGGPRRLSQRSSRKC